MKSGSSKEQEPCPVCGRPVVPGPSTDRHHWLPRSRGGRDSGAIHVVCHRKIHSVFTLKELASDYGTPGAVRAHPEIATFVRWVRRKPPGFIDSHARPKNGRGRSTSYPCGRNRRPSRRPGHQASRPAPGGVTKNPET